ncbi:fibroblast growth factor 1 isoform X2 [Eleutherodactylus coqui]|uniref:fibroblast growth factor 1 isoform X2 n=1 Tax=Eleutherodactylus coqui TaxID=57060 RepID=UPI0034629442
MAEGDITTFNLMTEKFDLPMGNYKKPKLLYCSNGGYFLRILPDGVVDGTRDRDDQNNYNLVQKALVWCVSRTLDLKITWLWTLLAFYTHR